MKCNEESAKYFSKRSRASFSQIVVRLSRINSTLPLNESSKFANIENFTPLFRKDNWERKRVLRRTQETFSGRFGVPDLNVLDYRKMARVECERNGEGTRKKSRSRASSRASQFVVDDARGRARMKRNDNKRTAIHAARRRIRENSRGRDEMRR